MLHNDPEIDFYARLPSSDVAEPGVGGAFNSPKHFFSMTVVVAPASKDCYFYDAEAGFDVDFQVLKGEAMDVGLVVFDPAGVPVVTRDPVGEANVA